MNSRSATLTLKPNYILMFVSRGYITSVSCITGPVDSKNRIEVDCIINMKHIEAIRRYATGVKIQQSAQEEEAKEIMELVADFQKKIEEYKRKYGVC